MAQQKPPSAPDPAKSYAQGISIYLKNLPQMLAQEQAYRSLYDPQRIAEQQGLQGEFGPTQYAQQLAALQQLDPQYMALYGQLGNRIRSDLTRGYSNAQQAQAYGLLGETTIGDLARGTRQTQDALDQEAQAIRAGQSARGNALGNAPAMAEALYKGQRGEQLKQQRIQNASGFYGLQNPQEKTYAQAGSFLSAPNPIQQIAGIQSVSPDRASAYVNPNAGYQGQQWGLQNYQNQLGQYAASGGGSNPWAGALAGAASGAASGTMVNFPYGTAVGAIGGGLAGYFSDPKTKTDVHKIGNVGLYNYRSKLDGHRYTGPMAPEIKSLIPSAVTKVKGLDFVKSSKVGLIPMKTVNKGLA
jgi:hypothetical protein